MRVLVHIRVANATQAQMQSRVGSANLDMACEMLQLSRIQFGIESTMQFV